MNVTESCFPNNAKFDIKIELNCDILSKTCSFDTKYKGKYSLAWEIRIGNKIIDKLNALLSKIILD